MSGIVTKLRNAAMAGVAVTALSACDLAPNHSYMPTPAKDPNSLSAAINRAAGCEDNDQSCIQQAGRVFTWGAYGASIVRNGGVSTGLGSHLSR